MKHLKSTIAIVIALLIGFAVFGQTITVEKLITEMTDLTTMAEFPEPPYTCKQFSSYDRKSKSPDDKDWFANGDAGQFIRVEEKSGRKEFVMMDAEGPGAIVRIWSANPTGILRIYLDGAETPVIEAPMNEILGGKYPGLPRPIAGEYSKGWNLYFPITYAKNCKVTSDKGGFYYHVNYRTYPAGTQVETFKSDTIKNLQAKVEQLARCLENPESCGAVAGGTKHRWSGKVTGGISTIGMFSGQGAVARIIVKVKSSDIQTVLRGVILKAYFDKQKTIEAPLGDFFGSAPGINPYQGLPLGMNKDGTMYCNWIMPYKESAMFELVALTRQDADYDVEFTTVNYKWTPNTMYFYAGWKVDFDVPSRPMIDYNYLTVDGKGVFGGVAFYIDNPVKDWWGEGDEKIYVDGEKFPSHFGTGTEDYYGYAWCYPEPFTHAYHAQARCDGPANYGRTSVNRFHIIDRIPFNSHFKFDMELWHWNENCKVNMALCAYYYAKAGAKNAFKPITAEMAIVRPMSPYTPPRVKGALEGEELKIVKATGVVEPQDWAGLSGERHLWWHAGMKPGDKLIVAFVAPKPGKYRVFARFLRAKDYGIHQVSINGVKAGEPMDFYNPDVKPSNEIELGVFDLKEKDNQFEVTVIGANEKAIKTYMFGLDYILLKPVE
ncbi:MAG: DUF2961 domain-containing protein [Verrucomicrobiae bacterium]|nr:DUF2961 domain-containing protein [Verrucomicrobiae bacterium]